MPNFVYVNRRSPAIDRDQVYPKNLSEEVFDDVPDAANGDATDIANDDATDAANNDATDVATKEKIAHGATKYKAADIAKNVRAPRSECLRTAEDATNNPDTAADLGEETEEEH